jgi:hypothetical protein
MVIREQVQAIVDYLLMGIVVDLLLVERLWGSWEQWKSVGLLLVERLWGSWEQWKMMME